MPGPIARNLERTAHRLEREKAISEIEYESHRAKFKDKPVTEPPKPAPGFIVRRMNTTSTSRFVIECVDQREYETEEEAIAATWRLR